jgi:ATP-dependent protease HslVU (ClpYQ) peptidase subunit
MNDGKGSINITKDDLSGFAGKGPAFVTFGETMIRDTPSDFQRLEMTRQVLLSLAGSELTLAMALARFEFSPPISPCA